MIKKIISGGQTGADQGGLCAGRILGLETGGTAPPNFMTENGPNKMLLYYAFGLVEGPPDPRVYPKRTYLNVKDSSGTVLFGRMESPGSRLTITLCRKMGRPYISNPTSDGLKVWVEENSIEILNVAGNRESKNPGICDRVIEILCHAFQ